MSHWMVEALFASSLLMLLVLVIRKHVAAQFGPRMAYWLWLLPALRMVMPPLPFEWSLRPVDPLPGGDLTNVIYDVQPDLALAATDLARGAVQSAVQWAEIGLAVWALGAVAHFALHIWAYRRFWVRAMRGATLIDEIDPGAIQVLTTGEVSGPLAMGLRRPAILVPADFEERYDPRERAFAIAHEVAHHRRGDLMVNLGALALLSLHWFNPLAHAAYRAFRTDQELACDATIMAAADREDRHAYACALVKSACDRAPMVTCSLNRKQELKQRLRMMRFGQLSAARGAVASGLGFALMATGLLATASVGASAVADTRVGRLVQDGIDSGGAAVAEAVMPEDADVRADEAQAEIAEKEAKIGDEEARLGQEEAERAEEEAQLASEEAEAHQRESSEAAHDAAEQKRAAFEAQREALQARREALQDRREAMIEARNAVREAQREAQVEAQEAMREAERDIREAAREADEEGRQAAREALEEARKAMREAMRFSWSVSPVPPVPPVAPVAPVSPVAPVPPVAKVPPVPPVPPLAKACDGKHKGHEVHVKVSRDGKGRQVHVIQHCSGRRIVRIDAQKMALSALRSARRQLAQNDQLPEARKREALKSIDERLARLRAELN